MMKIVSFIFALAISILMMGILVPVFVGIFSLVASIITAAYVLVVVGIGLAVAYYTITFCLKVCLDRR